MEFNKKDILKSLKNKSGVYLIINNITGDKYVGSSIILNRRIASHIYHGGKSLNLKSTNLIIYKAMRKYKLENFSLAILEFCKPDTLETANSEQK
jgi:group I intron endonuclease